MLNQEKIFVANELLTKGSQCQKLGNISGAIEFFVASVEIYPTVEALSSLSWAYSIQHDFDKAIEISKTAIEIDPEFGGPYNDIGSYFIELNNLDEAVTWLNRAILAPRYHQKHLPYFNLGRIYQLNGNWYEAINCYKKALEIDPKFEKANQAFIRLTAMLN